MKVGPLPINKIFTVFLSCAARQLNKYNIASNSFLIPGKYYTSPVLNVYIQKLLC